MCSLVDNRRSDDLHQTSIAGLDSEIDLHRWTTKAISMMRANATNSEFDAKVVKAILDYPLTTNEREVLNAARRDAHPPCTSISTSLLSGADVEWVRGEPLRRIGKGTFSSVYAYYHNQQLHAVKVAEYNTHGLAAILREASVLPRITHPYIVTMTDFIRIDIGYAIVMPAARWTLADYPRSQMTTIDREKIALQLLYAVQYLHAHGIYHGDLKPSNILIYSSDPIEARLCDFGASKITSLSGTRDGDYFTLWWRAPELLFRRCEYKSSADVWALGCIINEMVTGTTTFRAETEQELFELLLHHFGHPKDQPLIDTLKSLNIWSRLRPARRFSEAFVGMSKPMASLMDKMIAFNPSERASIEELIMHPIFDRVRESVKPNSPSILSGKLLPDQASAPVGVVRPTAMYTRIMRDSSMLHNIFCRTTQLFEWYIAKSGTSPTDILYAAALWLASNCDGYITEVSDIAEAMKMNVQQDVLVELASCMILSGALEVCISPCRCDYIADAKTPYDKLLLGHLCLMVDLSHMPSEHSPRTLARLVCAAAKLCADVSGQANEEMVDSEVYLVDELIRAAGTQPYIRESVEKTKALLLASKRGC